jgi:hypothetical protein
MKRLVEIDPKTGITKEFDHKVIRLSAQALKDYLLNLKAEDDKYDLRGKVLPIVEDALTGNLRLPLDRRPLEYELTEGLLPGEYSRTSARFWVYAMGMGGLGSELIQRIDKDGKAYAWMEFED